MAQRGIREYEGKKINEFPSDLAKLEKCTPVYEEYAGWKQSLADVKSYSDMPKNAKKYLERLSEIAGAKITLISTGAERGQIIKV